MTTTREEWIAMSTMNLLNETIAIIKENGKHQNDVQWVGSRDCTLAITWEEFKKIANFEYYAGHGGEEVALDLIVVGSDWWLERHEYDGSEWWEFKQLPLRNPDTESFNIVKNYDYEYELHGLKEAHNRNE